MEYVRFLRQECNPNEGAARIDKIPTLFERSNSKQAVTARQEKLTMQKKLHRCYISKRCNFCCAVNPGYVILTHGFHINIEKYCQWCQFLLLAFGKFPSASDRFLSTTMNKFVEFFFTPPSWTHLFGIMTKN